MQHIKNLLPHLEVYSAPLGRVFISLIFVMSGLSKMSNYANTAGWMDAMGIPGDLLLLLLRRSSWRFGIIVGWQTRVVSFLLAGFCVLSAVIFHNNFDDQNEMIHFMKNMAMAGGFLFLLVHGAGSISLDNRTKAGA